MRILISNGGYEMKLRKQIAALVTLAFVTLALASPTLFAQKQEEESTATLKETMDSLGSKLSDRTLESIGVDDDSDSKGFVHWWNEFRATFTVDNCNLILKSENIIGGGSKGNFIDELVLPFADIDPLSIEDFKGDHQLSGLKMKTTSPKKTIKFTHAFVGVEEPRAAYYKDSEKLGSNAFLFFREKENELRVKRAIKHAVKLCGGKVDPF